MAEGIGPDGTQLADERESILWGFVNCLDAQVRRTSKHGSRTVVEHYNHHHYQESLSKNTPAD